MIDPVIVHGPVFTTEAARPDERTLPVIEDVVQVTAPPPPGAALRTAKLPAEPSAGAVAAAWAAIGHMPAIRTGMASPRNRALERMRNTFVSPWAQPGPLQWAEPRPSRLGVADA